VANGGRSRTLRSDLRERLNHDRSAIADFAKRGYVVELATKHDESARKNAEATITAPRMNSD